MTQFEFVVSHGRAERVTAAVRSHAVKSGLQRRGTNQPATGSQHSQETVSQKAQLKGRFRLCNGSGKSGGHKKANTPKSSSSSSSSPKAELKSPVIHSPKNGEVAVRTQEIFDISRPASPEYDNRLLRTPSEVRCDPFETLPIDQSESVDRMMRHFLSQYAFDLSDDEIQKYWWGFTLAEPVVLHTALGVAASMWASCTPNPRLIQHEASKQKALAIRGIREKLARNECNNALIGAIANLSSMESILGDYDTALVHLRAIQKLLEYRGGMASLNQDLDVARAITWADLLTATGLGVRPLMPLIRPIESVRIPIQVVRLAEQPSVSHLTPFERTPTDSALRRLFTVIRQAHYALKLKAMPMEDIRHLINGLEHHMSTLSVEGSLPQPTMLLLQTACLFLLSCLRELIAECHLPKILRERVAKAMAVPANLHEATHDGLCNNGIFAVLWTMVVTAIASPRGSAALEQSTEDIRRTSGSLGLRHIDQIKGICQTFLWDEEKMGKYLKEFKPLIFPPSPVDVGGWSWGTAHVEEITIMGGA